MTVIVSIEDKLELFRKVAVEKFDKEFKEKVNAIDEKNKKILEDYFSLVEKKADDYFKNAIKEANFEKKRILTSAKTNVKNEILMLKRDIIEDLIAKLKVKVSGFMDTDEYLLYLKKVLEIGVSRMKDEGTIIIELSSKDQRGQNFVKEEATSLKNDITIELSDENQIGGLVFYNETKKYKIDYSLEQLINLKINDISRLVYHLINEAGDNND